MPADDEALDLTDSFVMEDDPNLHGTQELHGIQIKTTTDRTNLAGGEDQSPSKVHKNKLAANIEETKVNFFDPSKYVDDPEFQKPEEDQIIEAKVDAVEWRAELDRVYYDLVEIEKDLEVLQRGGGDLADDIEECRRHVDLIVEMCGEIKGVCTRDVTKVFQRAGETLEEKLEFIRRVEARISKDNASQIGQLNGITVKKRGLAVELREIIDTVKGLDVEHKNVVNELAQREHAFAEKMEDVTGGGHLRKLKTRLFRLRTQVEEATRTEGIMLQSLFACGGMRQGAHHLYDDILPVGAPSASKRDSQVTGEEMDGVYDEDFD